MNTKLLYAILILVVTGSAVFYFWKTSARPATPSVQSVPVAETTEVSPDTTQAINDSLKGVDLGDINQEFKEIDQTINTL